MKRILKNYQDGITGNQFIEWKSFIKQKYIISLNFQQSLAARRSDLNSIYTVSLNSEKIPLQIYLSLINLHSKISSRRRIARQIHL